MEHFTYLSTTTLYLSILVAMLTRSSTTQSNNDEFFITLRSRGLDSNLVTLECRRLRDGSHPDISLFFRNGEIFKDNIRNGITTFVLTTNNEGNFWCGERTVNGRILGRSDSNSKIPLIPYPTTNDISIGQFSANTGDAATINCSVTPGFFPQNYTVRWRNASDPSQVFYERSRFRTEPLSDRYSFDSQTLALVIDSVQPSDAVSQYVCDVSVFINMQDYPYVEVNQTLSVFEAPAFLMIPSPITVAENDTHNATFHCKVRSSPNPPTVTWTHVTSTGHVMISTVGCQDGHYCFTSRRIETVGGFQVNSQLTVIGVNSRDTGTIECLAAYSNSVTSSSLSMSTTLTVIGPPTKLEVISTDPIGYLIDVTLSRHLPVPVRVDLWFSNADDPSKEERSLEDEYFYNTTHLTAHRNRIPFPRFRVNVRILFGDDVTAGVFKNRSIVYERGLHAKTKLWITGSSLSGFFCFLSTVLLIIIAVLTTRLCSTSHVARQYRTHKADNCSHEEEEPEEDDLFIEEGGPSNASGNGHCRKSSTSSCGKREPRIAMDSGTPTKKSWREWLHGCLCSRRYRKKGLSKSQAKVFMSNLKAIVSFGLSDPNINKLMNNSEIRNEIWPPQQGEGILYNCSST